jgi:hypothetical protein
MPEYNADQIKMALTAAKDLAAARDARRQDLTPSQAELSQRSQIQANRRAADNLLASSFLKAGFEVEKFEELLAQNRSALQRITEERKAEALKRSSSIKETLRHAVETRRKTIEHLASATAAPPWEYLGHPFLIWPTPGVFFDDYDLAQRWARITLDSSKPEGHEELGFYYLWENPKDSYAVINIIADMVLTGFCSVESDGGFLPGDRRSRLNLFLRLRPWEWWNQPPTLPLEQVSQSEHVLELSTNTGGWFEDADSESELLLTVTELRYDSFLVPPHGVVVLEVLLDVLYSTGTDSGSIHVDFAGAGVQGDFEFQMHGVYIDTVA